MTRQHAHPRRLPLPDYRRRESAIGRPVTRFTTPQREFLESTGNYVLWVGANGIGKSLALAEAVKRAIDCELPGQTPGPVVVMLVGKTWAQLGSTLRYMWGQIDPRRFKSSIRFEAGGLKGQRMAVYDIVSGPGAGGELRCCIHSPENAAGPRADIVIADEPLPEKMHNELWPRLLGRDGRMLTAFTVTLGTSTKVEYAFDIVDNEDNDWAQLIHTPLNIANVTPRGGLIEKPWMGQEEIDRFTAGLSPVEREMRLGLSRHPRRDTVYFEAWGPHLLVDHIDQVIPDGMLLGIGIDHGSKPGAQRAVLAAVGGVDVLSRAWVIDEYKGDGRTEAVDDARGILDMISRNGYEVADIDVWVGDRSHRGDRFGGVKSNQRLKRSIAKALGHDVEKRSKWESKLPKPLRRMRTPYKYDRSVWEGCEILHRLMVGNNPRLLVSRRCASLNNDLSSWQGSTTDPHKDGIDAMRYIVVPMIEGKRW